MIIINAAFVLAVSCPEICLQQVNQGNTQSTTELNAHRVVGTE